jgi:hypothetical protein
LFRFSTSQQPSTLRGSRQPAFGKCEISKTCDPLASVVHRSANLSCRGGFCHVTGIRDTSEASQKDKFVLALLEGLQASTPVQPAAGIPSRAVNTGSSVKMNAPPSQCSTSRSSFRWLQDCPPCLLRPCRRRGVTKYPAPTLPPPTQRITDTPGGRIRLAWCYPPGCSCC